LLKRKHRRLVVRYELTGARGVKAVVGKWFSDDRAALLADALASLTDKMLFPDARFRVPALIAYLPVNKVVFMEAIEGRRLDDVLRNDQSLAAEAGAWLATFHGSGFQSPTDCGLARQRATVERWSAHVPSLQPLTSALRDRLPDLPNPRLPVHYDFWYSQVFVDNDSTVVLDFDQAGMGDPSYDVVRFQAQLDLLAIRWRREAHALRSASNAFRAGYDSVAPLPQVPPALAAFEWLRLAYKRLLHHKRLDEADYALAQARARLART
jgi:aminoglycoside phosphotransferase (APT) family kinase protein